MCRFKFIGNKANMEETDGERKGEKEPEETRDISRGDG